MSFQRTRLSADRTANLKSDGLVHAESPFPPSLTLMVALLLLVIGLFAIASMLYGIGPFG
jgi:putative membrane protein